LWQKALGSRAVLNAANFDAAVAQMGTITRDGGGPAAVRATHLVCGYSNRAAARTLLETQNIAVAVGTAAATISNANFGAVKLIVTPYLP
jgi:phage major head subunit gpT-like protein